MLKELKEKFDGNVRNYLLSMGEFKDVDDFEVGYKQGRADMKKEIWDILKEYNLAVNKKCNIIYFNKRELKQAIQKLNVTPKIYKSSQSPPNLSKRNVLQYEQADTIIKDKGEKS